MGRAPCCDKANVKRGAWSPAEDATLKSYLETHRATGGSWIALPQKAGLERCGKSCRLRWLNYLRPGIKHRGFTEKEDNIICTLASQMGNCWNTRLKKKILAGKINITIINKSINAPTTNITNILTCSTLPTLLKKGGVCNGFLFNPLLNKFREKKIWVATDLPLQINLHLICNGNSLQKNICNGKSVAKENYFATEFPLQIKFATDFPL
ncbi:transcription factor RAX [Salix suchowensis]|nr:transcription factor RAX [Salix suchowensis]